MDAIAITGLIQAGLEAFGLIQAARSQWFDYQKLIIRLNVERARLYIWSQTMGLTGDGQEESAKILLHSPFWPLVRASLEAIIQLLENGENLRSRHGCVSYRDSKHVSTIAPGTSDMDPSSCLHYLASAFDHFRIQKRSTQQLISSKTRWIIHDHGKFRILIQEIQDLVDGLTKITISVASAKEQSAVMRDRIQRMNDTHALNLLSDVCQDSHPDISESASVKLGVLSQSSDRRRGIEAWTFSIRSLSPFNEEDDDLDHMNASELRCLVRRLRWEMRRSRATSPLESRYQGQHPRMTRLGVDLNGVWHHVPRTMPPQVDQDVLIQTIKTAEKRIEQARIANTALLDGLDELLAVPSQLYEATTSDSSDHQYTRASNFGHGSGLRDVGYIPDESGLRDDGYISDESAPRRAEIIVPRPPMPQPIATGF